MKITKLILHKYLRLALSNIETFTYTPEADVQVILGTNVVGRVLLLEKPRHYHRIIAISVWVGISTSNSFITVSGMLLNPNGLVLILNISLLSLTVGMLSL